MKDADETSTNTSRDRAAGTASPLRLVFVGHVDHGKSTLVGRLLHDVGALPDGKLENIEAMCRNRGMPFEWAFVLDALKAERDQGITIDISQVWFTDKGVPFQIIDAPGHHEFIKNMVTGAAQADAAVLLVDAEEGVREQTRRHAYLLHLLGLQQVVLAVTKMDLVDHAEDRFKEVTKQAKAYLDSIGLDTDTIHAVPVTARDGGNVTSPAETMPWYTGPALLSRLHDLSALSTPDDKPLRMPIQDVYKFDHRRILAGRIEAGRLSVGDELLFSPGGRRARIASMETWHVPETHPSGKTAGPGDSVGLTLDQQLFIERGMIATAPDQPPTVSNAFRGRLFWLGRTPLEVGKQYKLKLATAEYLVRAETIERLINVDDLSSHAADSVGRNQVAEAVFRARGQMALDPFTSCPPTGRFVLIDDHRIVAGGLVDLEGFADQSQGRTVRSTHVTRVEHRVPLNDRWKANGHKSGILWFTGLPGSGKSTLAVALEEALFQRGFQTYVLDGDNVRQALSADLGFSPDDRRENIRRVGELAGVFANAGLISISAFISPYRGDRDRVRTVSGSMFHEIYLNAPLEVCEARDPRGLYAKARAGEIDDFTGISAPYEAPDAADLVLETGTETIEESLERLLDYTLKAFRL